MSSNGQDAGFGVYVHWPFCQSKCPYCDFNSHVRTSVDQNQWRNALVKEVAYNASLTPGRQVDSIFFGGGTPSLMPPETVAAVIQAIGTYWQLSANVEITLEANPTSVEAGRFKAFSEAGINRISMGIQSLRNDDLKALGRLHTAQEAKQAFDIAKLYFGNVSFDLIYARQNQTLENWKLELSEAISMAVDHLSLYQLTIEDGTRFGDLYARGRLRDLPSDDLACDLYNATQEVCRTSGMPSYEVSNHARPGAECKHNLIYWRGGDYAGIGPGAHGRITLDGNRQATEAEKHPETWLKQVENQKTATIVTEEISPDGQFEEYLMMSLRLNEGSNLERLQSLAPERLNLIKLKELEEFGLLTLTNQNVRTTPKGRLLLNAVLREILA